MKSYKHLSLEERERIFGFLQKGLSLRAVSRLVHRNVGTISRELGRHSKYGKRYLPCHAQKEAVRIGTRQRRRSATLSLRSGYIPPAVKSIPRWRTSSPSST